MMDGYWNDTALTKKTMDDGWVYTGDLGRFDDDGYLWFMGRKKDVIVRGGSNISPLEVEAVLNDHSSVAESCVVGVTDVEEETQEVQAYVVLEDGETVSEEQLREHCAERLAEYMLPAKVHFIDEMPQKGAGKMDRDLLRLRAETDVMDL